MKCFHAGVAHSSQPSLSDLISSIDLCCLPFSKPQQWVYSGRICNIQFWESRSFLSQGRSSDNFSQLCEETSHAWSARPLGQIRNGVDSSEPGSAFPSKYQPKVHGRNCQGKCIQSLLLIIAVTTRREKCFQRRWLSKSMRSLPSIHFGIA